MLASEKARATKTIADNNHAAWFGYMHNRSSNSCPCSPRISRGATSSEDVSDSDDDCRSQPDFFRSGREQESSKPHHENTDPVDITIISTQDSEPVSEDDDCQVSPSSSYSLSLQAITSLFSTSSSWSRSSSRISSESPRSSIDKSPLKPAIPLHLHRQARKHLPEALGLHGRHGYFTNDDNLKLACYLWPARTRHVKAVVVLLHGHGSHTAWDWLHIQTPGSAPSYHESWVEKLNQQGFSVCGLDHQGMGRSEGQRCFIYSFDHYCRDAHRFAVSVHQGAASQLYGFSSGLPTFLIGISLGGGIAAHVTNMHYQKAEQEATDCMIRGAVLLAPMLSLGGVSSSATNQLLKAVAGVLEVTVPTLELAAGGSSNSDPVVQQMFEQCPLTSKAKGTCIKNAMEYLRACARLGADLQSGQSSCAFPFLTIHSQDDSWTDPAGSQLLYDLSSSIDKQLVILDGNSHTLTRCRHSEALISQIIQWLDMRTQ